MPGRQPASDEDELDELPPLDGDATDGVDAETEPPDEDPAGDAAPHAEPRSSLDDSTGEDEPVDLAELGVGDEEERWLEEPTDAPEPNPGEPALVDTAEEEADASTLDDTGEPDGAADDLGLDDGVEDVGLDAGEEGPLDPDEELRDDELPAMDADDEDVDDRDRVDDKLTADEPSGVGWSAEPWPPVGAPVALSSATA